MKIAYFGYDFFFGALESLAGAGHQIVHVRTFDQDGVFLNFNDRLLAFATEKGIPVTWGAPSAEDMIALRAAGCDAVFVMGFKYRVPVVEGLRCVNLHPTLLPHGKGQFPLPWLILYHPEHSGLTLHRVTEELDSGPILSQMAVPLSADEGLESLCAKLQIAAGDFVARTARDFEESWNGAHLPVEEGSTWNATERDWMLNWQTGWQNVLKTVRAFGSLGSGARVEGLDLTVTDAAGWPATHNYQPGDAVHKMPIGIVVAAADGFVLLRSPTVDES